MKSTSLETLYEQANQRHSHYALSAEWVASQAEVEHLLGSVLQTVPSAFNSQPVRIVLLTGDTHQKHWDLVEQALIEMIGKEAYRQSTQAKIDGAFRSGIGTILFFDNPQVTLGLQEKFPLYAANFPRWAQEVQGSHQYAVWMGLSALGFGANLQHYTGITDDAIKQLAGVDSTWNLMAQMPFGAPLSTPPTPEKLPLTETLLVR